MLDRINTERLSRKYPRLARNILLAASIGKFLVHSFMKFNERRFELTCLFASTVIFVLVIYYFNTPNWLEMFAGVLIFLLSNLGLSFLDYKEKIYERFVEKQQLANARKLLALDVDNSSTPVLDKETAIEPMGYTPYQIVISNTIINVANSKGISLKLDFVETLSELDEYIFKTEMSMKGTSQKRKLNQIAVETMNQLDLKGLPLMKGSETELSVSIKDKWLNERLSGG